MNPAYEALLEKSREQIAFLKRQLKYLSRFDIKNFDHIVAAFHDEVFADIDCLDCANCCRVNGPVFLDTDIRQVCKQVGLDRESFVQDSLQINPEGGWRLREPGCQFLASDNRCSIYDDRPKHCQSYPHTHERRMAKGLERLVQTCGVCPAAYLIALKIIERFAQGNTK